MLHWEAFAFMTAKAEEWQETKEQHLAKAPC